MAAIRDNVRRYRKAGIVGDGRSFGVDYEEGLALYLSGERERGLAAVCVDNPYEAVWQPAAGTCERFVAASET